jgi:HEAT repeat protein
MRGMRSIQIGVLMLAGCAPGAGRSAMRFPWQTQPTVAGVKTPQQRIEELKTLADTSDLPPETTAKLIKEIRTEQDPLVRLHIVRVLAKLPDPSASAVLHAGLEDPENSVRIACCEAWGVRGGPEAVTELTTVLHAESNVDVRMAAAKALGATGEATAAQPLAEVLADNDPAIQRRAIESLKSVSGKDYGYDVPAWRQYAAGQPVEHRPVSFAERLRGILPR